MEPSDLYERYRGEYFELFHKMIGDIVLCNCKNCKEHPRNIRVEALGQALVDALARHIFALCATNVEMGEESLLQARRKATEQLNKFFTEFGHERSADTRP